MSLANLAHYGVSRIEFEIAELGAFVQVYWYISIWKVLTVSLNDSNLWTKINEFVILNDEVKGWSDLYIDIISFSVWSYIDDVSELKYMNIKDRS